MELGQRIRQARLEAGLSQRQLCGDTITRNMLSQIENGSAKPSMTTLQVLAQRLEKPISYFLSEEDTSEAAILVKAMASDPQTALTLLRQYPGSEPAWQPVHQMLLAKCYLALAEMALVEGKQAYALQLLEDAKAVGTGEAFTRQHTLLSFQAAPQNAAALAGVLPSIDAELLLLAQAALDAGDAQKCLTLLQAVQTASAAHRKLQGKAHFALKQYLPAAQALEALTLTPDVCAILEQCYKELRNFEKAYYYACLQR